MAVKFPETINKETFPAAWLQADRRLRRAKRGSLAYRTGALLSFPVFAFLVQIPMLRYLEEKGVGIAGFVLEKVPGFGKLWDQIYGAFFLTAQTASDTALAWGKMLYLLPLAIGLIPAALVLALYHPRKKTLPEAGGSPETASALAQMLRDAKKRAADVSLSRHLWGMIFAILSSCMVLFDYYTPLDGPSRVDMPLSEVFPVPHMYFVGVPLMMLAVLALMLLFWIAALPLNGGLKLFSLNPVSKKTQEAADLWVQQCQEPRDTPTPSPSLESQE